MTSSDAKTQSVVNYLLKSNLSLSARWLYLFLHQRSYLKVHYWTDPISIEEIGRGIGLKKSRISALIAELKAKELLDVRRLGNRACVYQVQLLSKRPPRKRRVKRNIRMNN